MILKTLLMTTFQPNRNKVKMPKKTWGPVAGLAVAIFSAIASSLCCIGPLVYLAFGTSIAGLSSLSALGWLQWPMIGVTLSLLCVTFWRLHISKRPYCGRFLSRTNMLFLFWVSVPVALLIMFYPFIIPLFLEY